MQSMQTMQNAQQLLNQALRGNQLPQQRPPQAQLQSEALIAMQRQQALQAQGRLAAACRLALPGATAVLACLPSLRPRNAALI
jgi:hypothetical protein